MAVLSKQHAFRSRLKIRTHMAQQLKRRQKYSQTRPVMYKLTSQLSFIHKHRVNKSNIYSEMSIPSVYKSTIPSLRPSTISLMPLSTSFHHSTIVTFRLPSFQHCHISIIPSFHFNEPSLVSHRERCFSLHAIAPVVRSNQRHIQISHPGHDKMIHWPTSSRRSIHPAHFVIRPWHAMGCSSHMACLTKRHTASCSTLPCSL